jgi:ABC-type microcin C transport system permease subunit YejE
MVRYIIVSIVSGILFGVMDGIININPLAKRLYEVYKPIARTTLNPLKGIIIDLVYGFVMSILFLLLYTCMPSDIGVIKGLCFGLLVWFFRVVMNNASQWVMFKVPFKTLLYSVLTGLGEMLILGVFYGLTL